MRYIANMKRRGTMIFLSMLIVVCQVISMCGITAHAEPVHTYNMTIQADSTTVSVGETINLTMGASVDGSEIEDLESEGYKVSLWVTSGSADINKQDTSFNASLIPLEAGEIWINYALYDSNWNELFKYWTSYNATEDESDGDSDQDGDGSGSGSYTISVSVSDADVTRIEKGDTIDLTASVVDPDGESIDLSASNLDLWWWTDVWNDHTDGQNDATYANSNGKSLSNSVTLNSTGTYYIIAELRDGNTSLVKECVTCTVVDKVEEVKKFTLSNDKTELSIVLSDEQGQSVDLEKTEITAGTTLKLTASVKNEGSDITSLEDSAMYLYWYMDKWMTGHEDGKTDEQDVVISNYDNNSGHSLTADVTFNSAGKYYIAAKLQDKNWNDIFDEGALCVPVEVAEAGVVGDLEIAKINNLRDDFVMGVDISSVIAQLNSGVKYYDFDGKELSTVSDFVEFLANQGITHVRVRVWNDPYDKNGNGYGGGNNDVETAKTIAGACKENNVKMLVDFHCSDFWADPGKQQAPKAWGTYSLAEKEDAVKSFITDSLKEIDPTKTVVDMVQVGNETNSKFVGESGTVNMCKLFQAGSEGVKAFNSSAKVVIHITNPEKGTMVNWAKNLSDNNVDYNILATSYYPYWHGSLDNLKSQCQTVINTYNHEVMVAETSYAFTLDDTDGHENTVRIGNNDSGSNLLQPFTVQGQATYLRDLMDTVNSAGGLGVFYWEPAWTTVGDTTGLTGGEYDAKVAANKELWERNGSGWASSYSGGYDPDDAGKWFGGSAIDNQALFYADGEATAAWKVWNYVKTGATSKYIIVETIEEASGEINIGGTYSLPSTINVTYNKGDVAENVTWIGEDEAKVDINTAGIYEIRGTVTFSKEVNQGTYAGKTTAEVAYVLTVKPENLINSIDATFDSGSNFDVTSGINIPAKDDPKDGTNSAHWWLAEGAEGTITYNKAISLEAGKYALEVEGQGYAGDTISFVVMDKNGTVIATGAKTALDGWNIWKKSVVNFELSAADEITFAIKLGIHDGGWGTLDCLYMYKTGDVELPTPTPTPSPKPEAVVAPSGTTSSENVPSNNMYDETNISLDQIVLSLNEIKAGNIVTKLSSSTASNSKVLQTVASDSESTKFSEIYNISNLKTYKGIETAMEKMVSKSTGKIALALTKEAKKEAAKPVCIYSEQPMTFNANMLTVLGKSKVNIVYYFSYKGHFYAVTIPAGVNNNILGMEKSAGPLYIGQVLGSTRVIK